MAQPIGDFSRLKRPIPGTQVAIKQLRDFLSCAWLPDLVQRSKDMLVEASVRIWNLTHFGLSDLKLGLLRAAHFSVLSSGKQEQQVTMDGRIRA